MNYFVYDCRCFTVMIGRACQRRAVHLIVRSENRKESEIDMPFNELHDFLSPKRPCLPQLPSLPSSLFKI
jgi:hypothetical protein